MPTTDASRLRKVLLAPARLIVKIPAVNAAHWNHMYRTGRWDHLDGETAGGELYKVIQKYREQPSILDLGCGKGVNLPLAPGTYSRYHGVDFSREVIRQAKSLGRPNATYKTADILSYKPHDSYDIIMLIEVLYYLPDAKIPELLRRLSTHLTPGGVMLVQSWDGGSRQSMIDAIESTGMLSAVERTTPAGDYPRMIYILKPG